jgi:AraC-like DNA-binding protein/mannose-6-phosphate isomerase-like protein (cupin superfamily)
MSPIGHHAVQPAHPRLRPFERARRPVVGYAHDYPAGWFTGLHAHPRAQLLYATSGVMRIEAEHASFVIPPGTGLFVPADVVHAVRMNGRVLMRALFLQERAAPLSSINAITVSPLLRELILAACDEPVAWSLAGRGRHLAALAVDEIARARSLPLSLPVPSDKRLRRVTDALLACPGDKRALAEHAAHAGASVRTLARLFLHETGMGFLQWRQRLRLTEALAALSAGRTLPDAAGVAGYSSLPAFGAAFRGAFGVSPGAMRATEPGGGRHVLSRSTKEDDVADTDKTKVTGTTSAPNPKTGSSDAARGLGGHSKDASHKPGESAQYLEDGEPAIKPS